MIELLSPAGNFEKLKAAVLYGANAVYFAGKAFGMRDAADNFTNVEIEKAIEYCRNAGVRAYIALNTTPHDSEVAELKKYVGFLGHVRPDAVIVADVGVFDLVKEIAPEIDVHVSTQANSVSTLDCVSWYKRGAKRVVLARELSLNEIMEIRKNTPEDLELEAFVHGSMCISVSGRCLLSEYYTGRNANNGRCTQPCRWQYSFAEIVEEKRTDDRVRVIENGGETFFLSSKDMCMIEHVPELIESGIQSLKIEGRMKSAYYTAVTTNAYRMAIDAYSDDPVGYRFDPSLLRELESVSHREYDTGFYFDKPTEDPKTTREKGYSREKAYIGTVISPRNGYGLAFVEQRNKLSVSDEAEVISPGQTGRTFTVSELYDEEMNQVESVPHPKMKFYVKIPFDVKSGDIIRM